MARVSIIGFAHGHVFSYAGVWRDEPSLGVELVAGWDHDALRGQKGCEQLGITYKDSLDDILDDETTDAVVISCETLYHAEYVEKAAKRGKRILCYKPMALTMEQADRIVKAVEENKASFSMGWQMRADKQNIKIKELLESGGFGRLFMIRRRHALSTHLWADFENTWHADPVLNRDIFADDSSHPADFMLWLLGKPETVTAEISSLMNPKVKNDNAVVVYKYANGVIAELMCSFTTCAAANTVEVYCEKGTILLDFGDGPSTRLHHGEYGLRWFIEGDEDWTVSDIKSPVGHGERIAGQAYKLAEFLCGGKPVATAEEGRDALRMVLAAYVSANTGTRVRIDDERVYNL